MKKTHVAASNFLDSTGPIASDDDRRLRVILESGCDLRENEREAFEGISQLEERDRKGIEPKLTRSQANWLESVAKREGVDLAVRGPVSRGREVPLPAVLQNLPKKPPGFKRNGP